jgi:hypothetical protein
VLEQSTSTIVSADSVNPWPLPQGSPLVAQANALLEERQRLLLAPLSATIMEITTTLSMQVFLGGSLRSTISWRLLQLVPLDDCAIPYSEYKVTFASNWVGLQVVSHYRARGAADLRA